MDNCKLRINQRHAPERLQLLETHRDAMRDQIEEIQANLHMIENKIARYRKEVEGK
jgi:hypothetical protein